MFTLHIPPGFLDCHYYEKQDHVGPISGFETNHQEIETRQYNIPIPPKTLTLEHHRKGEKIYSVCHFFR